MTRGGLALSIALVSALTLDAAGRTVWDGVYATPQAERGAAVYAEHCSRCHGDFLDGDGASERAAALTGPAFEETWESASLSDLFDKIARTMPRDAPGSLSGGQTLDLTAFLLRSNGYPAGRADLTESAALALIDIVGRDGPRPLRTGAGVRTVGCLTRDTGGAWTLVQAGVPARTTNPAASSGRDLERARATPLGAATIALAGSAPAAGTAPGIKVEVKGVLSALDPPRYGITVMSLQAIAPVCR